MDKVVQEQRKEKQEACRMIGYLQALTKAKKDKGEK